MKLKFIFIISAVLVVIAVYFAFFKGNNSAFNKYDFEIKDTSKIDLIILENKHNKLILSKTDNVWMLNNNFYANKDAIKLFLRIFSNLEFVSTVDENLKDSISDDLEKNAIKLILKSKNKEINKFYIGLANNYATGTYVKKKDSEPVIINAPGITNDISKIISTNSLFWRNKSIFNLNIEQIKNIEFHNFSNNKKSFYIKKETDSYTVKNSKHEKFETDNNQIMRYLSYFKNINFSAIENNISKSEKDSIIKTNKAFDITVTDINNINYKLKLIFKPNNDSKSEYKYDLNNIYALYNNDSNLLIIQYFNIDAILKEPDYFKK
ncbi:MAG: DUF4340 domain-containing protein [Bacteroidales bacterium]|nr:DUF4340 domain-containing protein [Bacteroidales bacterium]MBN2758736.1 DUF4340 domain-containing protein [Bacteroidales bacterium]